MIWTSLAHQLTKHRFSFYRYFGFLVYKNEFPELFGFCVPIGTQHLKYGGSRKLFCNPLSRGSSGEQFALKFEISKIMMTDLVPHEGVIEAHILEVKSEMERDGFQLRPIAISRLDLLGSKWKGKYMIHDGHHRTAALKSLNCTRIMGSIFDYSDPRIKVFKYYDTSIPVPKEEVVRRATSGIEVTPRYDKHFIDVNGKLEPFHDNDLLEPKLPTPLDELR